MTIYLPFIFTKLKPQEKDLAKAVARGFYSDKDDVYVNEWPDFLSKFNILTNVDSFYITAVDSDENEVTSPFANLKAVALNITFNCNDKMCSYIEEYIETEDEDNKYIGVTQPMSIGFPSYMYTPLFITKIDVKKHPTCIGVNNVDIYAYTFYKLPNLKSVKFYIDEE